MRDLDLEATVYGLKMSINTNYIAWNAETYATKQENSPRCGRSQNPPLSTEHDLTYDDITR